MLVVLVSERSGRSALQPTDEDLRSCLRCVDYVLSPRPPPPAPLPARLRGVSRLGPKLRSWDRGPQQRHRRRARADRDTASALLPRSPSPSLGQVRRLESAAQAKSNIQLAKIYGQTNLTTGRPASDTRHAPQPPPRYSPPSTGDIKEVKTLFASRAAERTAANSSYLAHLKEYVKAISKGGRAPAAESPLVIRNQWHEEEPRSGTAPAGPAGLGRAQAQGRHALPRKKPKGEPTRSAHRKDVSR